MPTAPYDGDASPQSYLREPSRKCIDRLANLATGEEGFAMHGLPIRHLMLPGDLAGSEKVLAFIASEISCNT